MQQQVAPRESKQTKQRLAEVVYRKRSRNSRKTNPPALAAKLGKSVCTCVYLYTGGKPLPREKSKHTLEIELSLVIGQSYNQFYASEHCMGKLCLCGVGLLTATVRNTTEETIIL